MIVSFRHKGLKKFFEAGKTQGIQPAHADRLRNQLHMLDNAVSVQEMNIPGWQLHPLKGELAGFHAVSVNGNWRLVFRFVGPSQVELVDYRDYH